MELTIESLKNQSKPEVKLEAYDEEFPPLDEEFVIGMKREKRNKLIDDLFARIKKDLEEIKEEKSSLYDAISKMYLPMLKKLK